MKVPLDQRMVAAMAHRRGPNWRPSVTSCRKVCDFCGVRQGMHRGIYSGQVFTLSRLDQSPFDFCPDCFSLYKGLDFMERQQFVAQAPRTTSLACAEGRHDMCRMKNCDCFCHKGVAE